MSNNRKIKVALYFISMAFAPAIVIPVTIVVASVLLIKSIIHSAVDKDCIANRRKREEYIKSKADSVIPRCPHCHSDKISAINVKSKFSFTKAAVGGVLIGGIGTAAGFIGNNKPKIMCLKCGHTWNI